MALAKAMKKLSKFTKGTGTAAKSTVTNTAASTRSNAVKDRLLHTREARANGTYKRSGYSEFNKKQEAIIQKAEQKRNSLGNANFVSNLDRMDKQKINGGLRGAGITGKTLLSGAKKHFLDPTEGAARRKSAYRGTFQAAAVSAAGHAGVAAINGDDPWEAAKTGFVRGAAAGGTYQSLKGVTGANAKSVWGNMKHINTKTKELYSATTVKGRDQLRKEGASGALSTLLSMESGVANNKSFFSKKANKSTAQVMNQQ